MGNFKKFMAMAAVSCMALTTMTACGNSGDAGSGDGDTNEIKIGLNYELSGETANYGTPEYNGSMLAMEYGGDVESMAQATFLTTVCAMVTVPLIATVLLV